MPFKNERFSAAIIGQQNSGKSTLGNALLGDWSNTAFAVDDVRTTLAVQEACNTASGITYVDTPGFGTMWGEDSAAALEAGSGSSVLIFVHSVRRGELDADEACALKQLASAIPGLPDRLFVVCSKCAEVEMEKAQAIQARVKEQIAGLVHPGVPVEAIDSRWYQDGKAAGDEDLVRLSRMQSLLTWLSGKAREKIYWWFFNGRWYSASGECCHLPNPGRRHAPDSQGRTVRP